MKLLNKKNIIILTILLLNNNPFFKKLNNFLSSIKASFSNKLNYKNKFKKIENNNLLQKQNNFSEIKQNKNHKYQKYLKFLYFGNNQFRPQIAPIYPTKNNNQTNQFPIEKKIDSKKEFYKIAIDSLKQNNFYKKLEQSYENFLNKNYKQSAENFFKSNEDKNKFIKLLEIINNNKVKIGVFLTLLLFSIIDANSFLEDEKFDLVVSLNFINNLYSQFNSQSSDLDLQKNYSLDNENYKKYIVYHELTHCISFMNPSLHTDMLGEDISEKININTDFIGDYYLPDIFNKNTAIFSTIIYTIFNAVNEAQHFERNFFKVKPSKIFKIRNILIKAACFSLLITSSIVEINHNRKKGFILFESPIFNQIKKQNIIFAHSAGVNIVPPINAKKNKYIYDRLLHMILGGLSGGCGEYTFESKERPYFKIILGMGGDLKVIYMALFPVFFRRLIPIIKNQKINENESLIDFLKKTEDKDNLILLSIEANKEENKLIINNNNFLLYIKSYFNENFLLTIENKIYKKLILSLCNFYSSNYFDSLSEEKQTSLYYEYSELLSNLVAYLAYKLIDKYKDPKFQKVLNNMLTDKFIQKSSYLNMFYVDKVFNENYKKVYGYELKKDEKLKNISQKAIDAMDLAFYKSIITKDMIKNVPDLWETILLHLENENRPEEFKAKIKNLYEELSQ